MKRLTSENFGDMALKNRVVMAPLARMRAKAGDVLSDLAAAYYAQRTSAGVVSYQSRVLALSAFAGLK